MELTDINDKDEHLRKDAEAREVGFSNDCEAQSSTQNIYLWNQLLAACTISAGSMIIGFSAGHMSCSLQDVKKEFYLSWEDAVWTANLTPLSAVVSSLVAAVLLEYCGRQKTILLSGIPFIMGWILIGSASYMYLLSAGRIALGISAGIISVASPIYLCESVQPELRGILGVLPVIFSNGGLLLGALMTVCYDWSKLAFVGAVLSLVFVILMYFVPESPRWYMVKGRAQEARNALQLLRGENTNIEKEIQDITRFQIEVSKISGNVCGNLFKLEYMPAMLICLGLSFFLQMSGSNFVNFYLVLSVHYAMGKHEMMSGVLGLMVHLISNVAAMFLVDRVGRKTLFYISSVSMILPLLIMGSYSYILDSYSHSAKYLWVSIVFLVLFELGYSIGFEPLHCLMLGEILPMNIRGTAAALATGSTWALRVYTAKIFTNVTGTFDVYGTYLLYAVMCFVGLLFVIFFVPETRGKSLEEIEKDLTSEPIDRTSNECE